ncbi:MAG TPA: type IV toxin-antitoxin system AbiEi family antitoxin domain-containing protein [Thermoleophilaceae bacterium]
MQLAELAARQHGVVARWQLYVLGFRRSAIQRRLESGRLHRVHRGVYAVGHTKLTERGRWIAAVLAFGPDALLSHRSCAALRSLLPDSRAVIDVTVPGRTRRGLAGVRLHLPRRLHPDDVDVHDGIPCTSVARMLLDVAETAPARQLEKVFEAAERERVLDMRRVSEAMGRANGHRGRQPLVTLSEQFHELPPTIRSRLERRFLRLCDEAGLPRPAMNVSVLGHEVDMLWADAKVIVELDSWRFHGTRQAFERDRRRDIDLQLAGHRILRFTWRRLQTEPHSLIAAVTRAIELASPA